MTLQVIKKIKATVIGWSVVLNHLSTISVPFSIWEITAISEKFLIVFKFLT